MRRILAILLMPVENEPYSLLCTIKNSKQLNKVLSDKKEAL